MDNAQREIFGNHWPRSVGVSYVGNDGESALSQWSVHSEGEWDLMFESSEKNGNIYTSICSFGGSRKQHPINHTVSFDLDSPYKDTAFSPTTPEDLKLNLMRDSTKKTNEVLSEVVDEASVIAEWAESENVPILGVFSGFGIHLHLLYRPTPNARSKLISTAELVKEELDVDTLDRRIIGDVRRILRVPNCMRVSGNRQTHVYTVPLSCDELQTLSPEEMLEMAKHPRENFDPDLPRRPKMQEYEEYLSEHGERPAPSQNDPVNRIEMEEGFEEYVRTVFQMPCISERIMQPDPDHKIRMNAAVMLFNMDWAVEEVVSLFSKFNWVDWNPKITRKQLHQIHNRKYSDMSCKKLQSLGKCVYSQGTRESSCKTYGWTGGDVNY